MARYNTSSSTNTITGAATIASPFQGAFTQFTGSAPYTVTLPAPAAFPGINQTFYNSTGGQVTISTPSGSFTGTGGPNVNTFVINSGNVVSVVPDGTNYIVISEDGSPLVATTGSFSGNVDMSGSGATVTISPTTITVNPTGPSSINNVNIGATTRGTGTFTTLAANQAVTFTANTSSSSSSTGTLVVTGGIGASGNIYSGANIVATNLTGTLQTASQPNVTTMSGLTSHGTLTSLAVSGNTTLGTVSSAGGKVHIGLTGVANAATSTIANMTDFALSGRAGFDGLANNNDGIYFGMGINGGINAGLGFFREAAGWNSALAFYTNNVTDGVNVSKMQEKMRIVSSGNVGIGTSTPETKLHIGNYTSDVAITLANLNNSSSRINFYDNNNTEGTYIKATGEGQGGTITFGARWDDDEDKMVLKMYQVSAGGNYHIRAGIGNTAPDGTLHVTASPMTAAAPSLGWPNYINPDADASSRLVGIFDTAGNGSVATAGYGPTVVLRLGQYYDSRVVITPYGAGGASPSDQGTGRGKDLMVKGGQSDNGNGFSGGRLFLNGGAGFNGGAYGARGVEGQVRIQNQGGNTFIGAAISNTSSAGNNMLYLPFQYNDSGEYAPQRASGMLHLGSFTHRADNQYLDIRLNQGASMFMFHIYGYLYNSANINTWIGGYSYTGNSILNLYVQNLGNCSATVYRTTTNNILCLKINRNASGYSEGKVNVFYHAWTQGEMEGMAVTSYAQNNSANNYYTS
jgi:hypothetical protein